MAEQTGISWTDHTANFWWGCVKVSPGCANCYAEAWSKRYGRAIWGPAATTERWRTKGPWRDILRWDARAAADGVRRRVFTQSMSDFFEEHPQLDSWRAEACEILAGLKHLDVQLLTKRPENVRRMVPAAWWEQWPAHVWIGTSVENQEWADRRIPALMAVPAAVHFLSCEPLLGPIELPYADQWADDDSWAGNAPPHRRFAISDEPDSQIDWVIVGGESGHGARPMNPDWARSLRDQCRVAGVPFHFKQWGEYGVGTIEDAPHPYSGQVANIPGYGLVGMSRAAQVWPNGEASARIGKKRAGRLLDGREWSEFPASQ